MAHQILVIRGGAIGDFVLTLPALAALRKTFPQARLEILGYPYIAGLAILGEVADAVHSLESPDLVSFFTATSELNPSWKHFFGRFDLILSYVFDPEKVFETNIKSCCKARFISGPHRPTGSEPGHATELFLKPLEQLGIGNSNRLPILNFEKKSVASKRRIAAHPGSGSPLKNWPEARWLTFLEGMLSGTDAECLLIGGEAEGNRLQHFAKVLGSKRLQLAHHLPLPEVARLLGSCVAFVGHDSGISHLAAAIGLPSLILWGQTNEEIWRPLGRNVKLLRGGENLSELSPELVLAELKLLLQDSQDITKY
ncbi:MAG: rfaC 1 [Verrucomicrobiales bacterium]|nr:rfaC 1 [Verrucomicrobiales bacterium]